MFMTATMLGLALAVPAPQDSEIEPVDQATVEFFLNTAEATGLCEDVDQLSNMVDVLGGIAETDVSFIFDMAASYWQDAAEEGIGETAAMTLEAEDTFRAWVYDCGGRIDTVLQ